MEKNMAIGPLPWRLTDGVESGFQFNPPDAPLEPMEFLSRSWSFSALQLSKALARAPTSKPILSKTAMSGPVGDGPILEDVAGESAVDDPKEPVAAWSNVNGNPFSFASWETSTQLLMDRIMSQSQEVSPRTSGRSSHSSGPLAGSSLPDISPVLPSEIDDLKYCHLNNTSATTAVGGGKAIGRRTMKEKRKEETRPQSAQLHAAVSVAGVAAAVAPIAAAASSSRSTKDRELDWTDMAVASAATLVAAQCVEAAESIGAEREHLASVVSSAVNARSADSIMTLTAAAATALRGAATVKARALKEVSSVAAVLPMEKGNGGNSSIGSHSDELVLEQNFLGICSRKLLARGCELLKRTRKGDLHWKIVSVYINRMNQVTLKMKSRHVGGTLTKKKKYVVLEVVKGMPAWAGRYLLEGGENRRYFGLKTDDRGLIEFECRNQREYEAWTEGVSRLLSLAAERSNMYRI